MTQAAEKVGDYMVVLFKQHIQQGVGKDGALPRGSDKYEARKLKKWGQQPVLVASGELLQSIGHKVKVS